jgi:hypothetical protein
MDIQKQRVAFTDRTMKHRPIIKRTHLPSKSAKVMDIISGMILNLYGKTLSNKIIGSGASGTSFRIK